MDTFYLNAFLSALSLLLAIIAALLAVRISELKKRLDTIEKNNLDDRERFRTFFDGVNDAVIIHESDGRIVGINRKASDMFGIPLEKTDNLAVIKNIFNIDMTNERIRRIWSQVMEGEVAVLPWMLKMPCSGDTFEVELTLRKMLFPDNGIMIISTVRDMTRSNMAESEIRRLAAVVEQVDESVMICDRSSRIIYVNPFFERITGYQALEVLGEKTGILKSGAHDSDFYKGIWEIITAGKNWHGILRNRKKDGTFFDEEATIFPIKNQKSEIAGYAAVKRDITQKLKDELALKNAKENAEKLNIELESVIAAANAMSEKAIEASRAKSEFIASVSHELRTPLNIILGSIELMAETEPDAEQDKYLTVCRNACESLLDIISGILDISKIEAGQLHIENIPFDLRSIIEDIILLNSFRAESKGIKLVTEISDDIPSLITGDPARIRQILINLVNNAIKFTENGEIKVKAVPLKRSSNNSFISSDFFFMEFSVIDTGIGISADNLDRIFDEFIQADSTITRKYGGTGLGLTISKKLVNLMGGAIHAESSPGRGSRFVFTIRCGLPENTSYGTESENQASLLSSRTGNHNMQAPEKRLHILLAEDIPDNRMLITKMLSSVADIDTAENGIEAVEKFRSGSYDLVIMDIQMPEMDGYTAAVIIRELEISENLEKTPLVALTAFATSDELKKSVDAGFLSHVTKPVRKADLVEAVFSAIKKHSEIYGRKTARDGLDGVPEKNWGPDNDIPYDNIPGNDDIGYNVIIDPDIEELVPFFFENRRNDLEKMRSAILENNFETIKALGHSLKGTGGSYGFHFISEKGAEIEDAASVRDSGLLLRIHRQLANYLEKVQIRFE